MKVKQKLKAQPEISARVYRVATGKWEDLGVISKPSLSLLDRIRKLLRGRPSNATVLTQVGEEWIVDKLDEVLQTTGDYIGWGTGTGTAAKSDTALFTEASEARVTATRSQPVADKIRWVGALTAATAKTITNAGNFTASTAGTLIVHGDFTGIPLAINDKIEFTIELEIT